MSEWRLGVRPPLEGLHRPEGSTILQADGRCTQGGDMPALFQTRSCYGHQGGTGGSVHLAWGYVGVSSVQKGRK